jgi:hypothetical protein
VDRAAVTCLLVAACGQATRELERVVELPTAMDVQLAHDGARLYVATVGRPSIIAAVGPDGSLTVLVDDPGIPVDLAVTSSHAWWTTRDPGRVMRVGLADGLVETVFEEPAGSIPTRVVAHGETVCWAGVTVACDRLLLASTAGFPTGLVADDVYVYFATFFGVARVARPGGEAEALLEAAMPTGLAVEGSEIYTANADGTIRRGEDVLAPAQGSIRALLLEGDRLYFTTSSADVRAIPREGGRVEVLALDQPGAGDLVIDGSTVYVAVREGVNRTSLP